MLSFKKVSDEVLEVKEVVKNGNEVDIVYVYYDLGHSKKSVTVDHQIDKPVCEIPFTEKFMSWLTKQFYHQLQECGMLC